MKKILMLEDLPDTRRWLVDIVHSAFPNSEICEADSVSAGECAIAEHVFDLALIDLGLPDGSGLTVLRHLAHSHPDTICVITTVVGDDAHIVSALSAGAHGYLLKEHTPELLRQQLLQLVNGMPALSPAIAKRIMLHFQRTGPASACDGNLTQREKETLALISRGYRNSEAAGQLGIAESTVATHIKAIYRKLGISTRAEASWHATRLGL